MKKVNTTLVRATLLFSITLSVGSQAFAQNGWNWGEQVDLAKEKNVVYTDALKAKNYAATVEPLNWLLTNTPDLNPSIYINGAKIYENLAKQEEDPAKKEELIQKGIDLHDARIQYFGKEGDVTGRKASFAYKFWSKEKSKYEYLYELFTKAFELQGNRMGPGNLVAYMNMIYKYRFVGGDLPDEQVIDKYTAITGALEYQKGIAKPERKDRYTKMMGQVDKLLTATKVEISCEFVETKLGPKLDESGDLNMAKKVFDLLLKAKCLESPYALKAAEIVQNDQPTYGIAKFMAQKNTMDGNNDEAIRLYREAADLTEENTEKAEMYVKIAELQRAAKQKPTARNSARRALSFDPSFKDAFELIGDLYMTSANDCNQGVSRVDDRAIYIAAYDQYRRAGHSTKMANAKAQFPSIEEIFNEGKEEGESITIGCWINTTVKLERRPAN